jgi:hypothetical protein
MRLAISIAFVLGVGCSDRSLYLPEAHDLGAADQSGADRSIVDQSAADQSSMDQSTADQSSLDLWRLDLWRLDLSTLEAASPDLSTIDLATRDLSRTCGVGDVLVGRACVRRTCQAGDNRLNCLLPDGSVGQCSGLVCETADLMSDPDNCGLPGAVCPTGGWCSNGICSGSCSSNCPAGMSCSESGFYGCALATCDGKHDNQACDFPIAMYGGLDVPGQCCGTRCVQLLGGDANNCGACGRVCKGGCFAGHCDTDCTQAIDNLPCALGEGYCCNGTCVTQNVIGAICGIVGLNCPSNPCPAGTACVSFGYYNATSCAHTSCSGQHDGSVCASVDADGVARAGQCCAGGCADTLDDPHNCGTCGHECPGAQICLGGACVPQVTCDHTSDSSPCLMPNGVQGVCCGSTCVDVESDVRNCGGCALACPPGTTCNGATGLVNRSQCVDATGTPQSCQTLGCPSGYSCTYVNSQQYSCEIVSCAGLADGTICAGGECCSGSCVSLFDLANCASCGRACPTGADGCSYGDCERSFSAIACSTTAPCPAGNTCISVTCPYLWPNSCSPQQCFPSSCAGRSDGVPCAAGGSKGACCAGACVNLNSDPANCGQCGRDCGGSLCRTGKCEEADPTRCVPTCPAGTVCVEDDPFYLRIGVCVGPVCGVTSYDYPFIDNLRCLSQDGHLGDCCPDGSCADLARDPENCGGCGTSCGGGACVAGRCQ